jgi:putative membrane-bound dehydrogenase-like protein
MRSAACLFLLLAALAPLQPPAAPQSPLTPQQAQKEFRLAPGLRIELIACEPQIESPVAMAFDEDGKLWVVEMPDYPNGPGKGEKPHGRIKILEDKDGDGFYETATVFADNLLFANGLLRWRDGVIVTAAPHIVFLRDTQGTGKCDKREVLYEGFATQNPQLRVSHPVLGLDGWIYCANGLRGGKVTRAGDPQAKPVDLSGRDFRFDPLGGGYEAISGLGQFGNTFDDWGNRFVCDNRHHLRHVVLPHWALARNPYLGATEVVNDPSVLDLDPGPLSSGGRVYPISKNWTTSNLHAARFTAACGVMIYRSPLLGQEHYGTALTCEPTGNLVHEEVLTRHGATFTAKPMRDGVEFLATADDWCRPVSLAHGPDGALYVVDMYRAVIEHPDFMPPELKNRPDLTLGKDRGRIWRIVPEKHKTKTVRPNLSKATPAELVKLLDHDNAWWRTTAQRLLLQNGVSEKLAQDLYVGLDDFRTPQGQVHAVGLILAGNEVLGRKAAASLLTSPHAAVRQLGLRLAYGDGKRPVAPTVGKLLGPEDLAEDADAGVRFEAALALAGRLLLADEQNEVLARIALAGIDDHWTHLAVAIAAADSPDLLLRRLLTRKESLAGQVTPGRLLLTQELAGIVGARRHEHEVAQLLLILRDIKGQHTAVYQRAGLVGLAEGMGRRGTRLDDFLAKMPESERPAVEFATRLLAEAGQLAVAGKGDPAERLAAVRLLAHAPWKIAQPPLLKLLTEDAAQELRLAAVRALAAQPHPEVAALLLKSWKGYTPALRREVTEALLRQPERTKALLKAIEAGTVKAGDIDAARSKQLLNHKDPVVRDLAKKLLQDNLPAERKEVLAKYQASLKLKGDAARGKLIFQKNCATCHRVAGIGVDVGPDISDTRTKTLEGLLVDILNPNAAIDNNYVNYVITTKDGRTLTGMISTETATGITLKRAENQTDTVLRADIEEILSTGQSLMPEGLEKGISVEEMADLLSFLKNWRYLDGAVPK